MTAGGIWSQRVVAATSPLFVARGYLDTTMAELAGAAGVAVQTLYLAFGSKAAVLQAVWDAGPDRPQGWAEALAAAFGARVVRAIPREQHAHVHLVGARLEPLEPADDAGKLPLVPAPVSVEHDGLLLGRE